MKMLPNCRITAQGAFFGPYSLLIYCSGVTGERGSKAESGKDEGGKQADKT